MAKARVGHRVEIQLDPRVGLEEIILNRLERLPARRRQEWLRGLLVQGLLTECQAFCRTPDSETFQPAAAFRNWKTSELHKPDSPTEQNPPVAAHEPRPVITANKPFAALGKVIG
ncbi:MAG: hypothetical protein KUF79_09870 [Candidatus Thiodiazotropha sp. (ex Ctena orbiculata)]|nr:hypothetical protein [Candidatus Thiodiazotropha taylori]